MTQEEFKVFATELFNAFPSLNEWLRANSPEPKSTLAVWQRTLENYSQEECLAVVSSWASGELPAFEAYERDKVHLLVRSIAGARRDRARKREERNSGQSDYQKYKQLGGTPYTDSQMATAVKVLRPLHRKMVDGELSEAEYRQEMTRVIELHVTDSAAGFH